MIQLKYKIRGGFIMGQSSTVIAQKDGYESKLYSYYTDVLPKASILLIHGMAEHHDRYTPLAEFFNNHGYDVYSYDHRGHGTDKQIKDLGYFADEKGYEKVVQDAMHIANHVKHINRSSKLFIISHSMGSIITRNLIQSMDDFSGVIISGTTYPNPLLTHVGICITSMVKKIVGPKHLAPKIDKLLFGGTKYKSLTTNTPFDWLTRDENEVNKYIEDEYCGFICTTSFYNDLVKLTSRASNRRRINKTRKDLPLFFISGDKDPVGGYGKEIKNLVKTYKSMGFTSVQTKLYPSGRHEIFNELNKEEVYNDMLHWIRSNRNQ